MSAPAPLPPLAASTGSPASMLSILQSYQCDPEFLRAMREHRAAHDAHSVAVAAANQTVPATQPVRRSSPAAQPASKKQKTAVPLEQLWKSVVETWGMFDVGQVVGVMPHPMFERAQELMYSREMHDFYVTELWKTLTTDEQAQLLQHATEKKWE
jgi:hypothetical protein